MPQSTHQHASAPSSRNPQRRPASQGRRVAPRNAGGGRPKRNRALDRIIGTLLRFSFIFFLIALIALVVTRDYGSPMAEGQRVFSHVDSPLNPTDFIASVYDSRTPDFLTKNKSPQARGLTPLTCVSEEKYMSQTALLAEFVSAPNPANFSEQKVQIRVSDAAGHDCIVDASLVLVQGPRTVTVEAGSDISALTEHDFVQTGIAEPRFATGLSGVDVHSCGAYAVPILLEESSILCHLIVADTVAPTATAAPQNLWLGGEIDPATLVTNIYDMTEVKVSFAEAYDFSVAGTQQVTVLLTDGGGNVTQVQSSVNVMADTVPPVITGAKNLSAALNGTVTYRGGVTVTDNLDTDVALEIDSSAVKLNVAGVYPVVYSATDRSGNTASVTVNVTVLAVSDEEMNEKADALLATILTPDMTDRQKARAIYNWVSLNVTYTYTPDELVLAQGVYNALVKGRGDCFTFYAASEVLLTRAGIENMRITRIEEATSSHYWNLVNIDGKWYHFDTCPALAKIDKFLFTNQQAKEYTAQFLRDNGRADYFSFYPELYPEIE